MKKKNKLVIFIICILLLPILMLLAWVVSPKTKLVIAIIDKTVLTDEGQEHISLDWILNHEKYTKTNSKFYKVNHDYFGFFPKDDYKFKLKGLERFTASQLEQLSNDAKIAYFTDTYGIYKKEWYNEKTDARGSGILYGGLSKNDIDFAQLMKAKRKLIISEFNTMASPTNAENRARFEQLFGLHWTGWTARYFDSLDPERNTELPPWLIKNYNASNTKKWPFKKGGIAFVSDFDQVVILEDSTHMTQALPHMVATPVGLKHFDIPDQMKYPFWFDVITSDKKMNQTVADYKLDLNKAGKNELTKYGIPTEFPAVVMHRGDDYRFYYFAGDFCDNPIGMTSSYFKGIRFFKFLMFNVEDKMERKSFFWNFYRPMVTKILEEESRKP